MGDTRVFHEGGQVKHGITIGEKYRPAMEVTTQAEAAAYFEKCVAHTMGHGKTRSEAEAIERANIGYFAGYYDDETRRRVEHLYGAAHPIFGKIAECGPATPEQALDAEQIAKEDK